MGRLKELVASVSGDMSSLEKQAEQTDATFGVGAAIQLASLVLKSLLLMFTKQQKGVLQPPSSLPDYCRTPDQTKIKIRSNQNLERLYNCLVGWSVGRHAQNSSDVTLAFEDAD